MSEKPRRATATEAIHGVKHDEQFHSVPYPIYQSANFAVEQSDDYRHYINDDLDDFYIYSRPDSPTQRAVELKLAKLEHGEDALMTASGMAAITTAVLSVVKAGDTIAASKRIYGTTYGFLANIAPQFGIQTVFLDDEALYDIEHHAPQAKLVYFETPINPTVDIVDIAAVVEAARKIGALTMLDSTFASPINQNPLDWGVDVVVHSATKYLGGHSDLVAGAIIGGETQVQAARNLLKVFGGI
ncbi:MAG: PLP-dependent transferase, partial [Chloroflexi bacterium]